MKLALPDTLPRLATKAPVGPLAEVEKGGVRVQHWRMEMGPRCVRAVTLRLVAEVRVASRFVVSREKRESVGMEGDFMFDEFGGRACRGDLMVS